LQKCLDAVKHPGLRAAADGDTSGVYHQFIAFFRQLRIDAEHDAGAVSNDRGGKAGDAAQTLGEQVGLVSKRGRGDDGGGFAEAVATFPALDLGGKWHEGRHLGWS